MAETITNPPRAAAATIDGSPAVANTAPREVSFPVTVMTCASCVNRVEKAIGKSMDGLSPAELQSLLAPKAQELGATG